MNRLPSTVDDELRRHHPLVEHELQAAVGPADRREPPGLVEQVGGAADLLPARMPSPDRRGIAETPVLLEHRQMLPAPGHVVVEAAAGQDHAVPGADALRGRPSCLDHRARHGPVDIGDRVRSSASSATAGCRAPSAPAAAAPPATDRSRPSGHRTPAPGTSARSASPERPCRANSAGPGRTAEDLWGRTRFPSGAKRQRLQQVLFLVAELAQVDRGHVDRAAELGTAGQLRVVVSVARFPDELEPAD